MDVMGCSRFCTRIGSFVVPLVLYKLYPPELKKTDGAQKMAAEKLKEMGAVSKMNG
jgi:DASS family divalent anion:Na+ symporter